MNSAEIKFWGSYEAITEFLSTVRRPGERGETLLAELLKMKAASEAEPAPDVTAQELLAV